MATITSVKKADREVPNEVGGLTPIHFTFTISATLADNTDVINLFDLPEGAKIFDAGSNISATLGASSALRLRCATTALCAASTAGGADFDQMNVTPYEVTTSGGETVNWLVSGADISGAATGIVSMLVQMP